MITIIFILMKPSSESPSPVARGRVFLEESTPIKIECFNLANYPYDGSHGRYHRCHASCATLKHPC